MSDTRGTTVPQEHELKYAVTEVYVGEGQLEQGNVSGWQLSV